jgi:hypothetical protein
MTFIAKHNRQTRCQEVNGSTKFTGGSGRNFIVGHKMEVVLGPLSPREHSMKTPK